MESDITIFRPQTHDLHGVGILGSIPRGLLTIKSLVDGFKETFCGCSKSGTSICPWSSSTTLCADQLLRHEPLWLVLQESDRITFASVRGAWRPHHLTISAHLRRIGSVYPGRTGVAER